MVMAIGSDGLGPGTELATRKKQTQVSRPRKLHGPCRSSPRRAVRLIRFRNGEGTRKERSGGGGVARAPGLRAKALPYLPSRPAMNGKRRKPCSTTT
jgi:hypothetical protein